MDDLGCDATDTDTDVDPGTDAGDGGVEPAMYACALGVGCMDSSDSAALLEICKAGWTTDTTTSGLYEETCEELYQRITVPGSGAQPHRSICDFEGRTPIWSDFDLGSRDDPSTATGFPGSSSIFEGTLSATDLPAMVPSDLRFFNDDPLGIAPHQNACEEGGFAYEDHATCSWQDADAVAHCVHGTNHVEMEALCSDKETAGLSSVTFTPFSKCEGFSSRCHVSTASLVPDGLGLPTTATDDFDYFSLDNATTFDVCEAIDEATTESETTEDRSFPVWDPTLHPLAWSAMIPTPIVMMCPIEKSVIPVMQTLIQSVLILKIWGPSFAIRTGWNSVR